MLSIIIPAHNEEAYLGACLSSVAEQQFAAAPLEVVVMANACTDRTVAVALGFKRAFAQKGWKLWVLRTRRPGKLAALNCADTLAQGHIRVYLDADVICTPLLMAELYDVLSTDGARYATGTLSLAPAKSWVTQQYARLWQALPFMQGKAPGAGVFAVNAAGRARWGAFPEIISDDTFVRLSFAPDERHQVAARYQWPLVEGFANLVKVRRRQNAGVAELRDKYPALFDNDDKQPARPLALLARMPVSFAVYAAVSLAVRLGRGQSGWTRGR